jgi:hypothetical protein
LALYNSNNRESTKEKRVEISLLKAENTVPIWLIPSFSTKNPSEKDFHVNPHGRYAVIVA